MAKDITQKICSWKLLADKDTTLITQGNEPTLRESDRDCYQCAGTKKEMSNCPYIKKSNQEKKEVEVPDQIQKLLKNRPENILDYRNLK